MSIILVPVFYFPLKNDKIYSIYRKGSECIENRIYSAAELAKACDIIIIGVKPDTVASVMEQIAPVYTPDKIIISMAAGISIRAIEDMAGVSAKVIRIMPNKPVMVGEGMTAIL